MLGSITFGQITLAAELASLSPAGAATACDALIERGILAARESGEFRFGHQIVRDALYQQIGPAERWRWHTIAAESLARLPASPERDLQIAVHLRETAQHGDTRTIAALARAGDIAGVAAPRSAIPWYRQAIALGRPEQDISAELTARLARIYLLAGQPENAVEASRSALERLPAGKPRDRLVPLAIEALIEHSALTDAVKLVESERMAGRWTVRLSAQASYVLAVAGQPAEAQATAHPALIALSAQPPVERINTVVPLIHMRCVVDGYGAVDPLLAALRAAADADIPPAARLNAHSTISYVLAMRGDTAACTKSLTLAEVFLPEPGWRLYQAELAVARAQNAANLGDWNSALSLAVTAAREMEETGSRAYLAVARDLVTELLAHRGEWAAARRGADTNPAGSPSLAALAVAARTPLDVLAGDLAAARSRLVHELGRPRILPRVRAVLLGRLAEVSLESGDTSGALEVLAELDAAWTGVPEHTNAIRNAYSRGRASGDTELIRAGISLAEEHSLAFARGQGALYLGIMDVHAKDNLAQAVRIFHSLGATPWRRRAAAELRARGLKVPRHRTGSTTLLNEPEAQIARLVQLGRSNRDIASAVSLSVKTVEAYLSRIYSKTGCAGRFELARALDAGLLD